MFKKLYLKYKVYRKTKRIQKEKRLIEKKKRLIEKQYKDANICSTYSYNSKLDIIQYYMDNIGISKIDIYSDDYYFIVLFKDGTEMTAWNVNRWFAWMNRGKICFSNGEKLEWEQSKPKDETLYKLREMVLKLEENDELRFEKYLPDSYKLKIKRLKKLDKLERKGLV